jgi:PTH2 family peptidyl-tRNA hydrolase
MQKQAIIFRKDLKMGKGKLAAHAAHASLGSMRATDGKIVETWEKSGEKKVVLKIEDEKKLREIYKKAKDAKLPCFLVKDAGLTQLKAGTITAVAIGPADEKKIDKITGKLKLL